MKKTIALFFSILFANWMFAGQFVNGDSASDMKLVSKGGVQEQGNGILLFPARKYSALVLSSKQFPTERGSISFMISPLNWNGRDGKGHRFIQVRFANGKVLTIYKYPNGNMESTGWGILARYVHEPGKAYMIIFPNNRIGMTWEEKSWHHIVLNWEKDADKYKMELFMDGSRVGMLHTNFQFEFSPEVKMYIGPDNDELASSLFRAVTLNSTPLDAEKITAIYEKFMEDTEK